MMTPGQPVLFFPALDLGYGKVETPFGATIAHTNADGTVNLSVIDHGGSQFALQNVRFLTAGEPTPDDGFGYVFDVQSYAPTNTEQEPAPPAGETPTPTSTVTQAATTTKSS